MESPNLYTDDAYACAGWIRSRGRLSTVAVFVDNAGDLSCLRLTRYTESRIDADTTRLIGVYGPGCQTEQIHADIECHRDRHYRSTDPYLISRRAHQLAQIFEAA